MATSKVFNTGYFSISTDKEHLFLSVTPSCKHGPGIQRDGVTLPRMKDPHSIPSVLNEGIGHLHLPYGHQLEDTTNAFEQRVGTWTIYHHLKEFIDTKGEEWTIIGVQGCGDLTMNPWHIAFLGSNSYQHNLQNTLCAMLIDDEYKEPIEKRVYRCLVKWKEQASKSIGHQYEFLNLKFIDLHPSIAVEIDDPDIANQRKIQLSKGGYQFCALAFLRNAKKLGLSLLWVMLFQKSDASNGSAYSIASYIEFAVAGKTIIEKGYQLPLVAAIDKFQDVRHIFSLPNEIKCHGTFQGKTVEEINLGEYQLYRDLNARRAALNSPIIIDINWNEAGGYIKLDEEELMVDLQKNNFKLVSQSPRGVAEYCFHTDNTMEIYFPKNVYPFGLLGMKENKIFCLSSSGLSGRIGNTLEGITRIMIDQFSCEEAMVLDEGLDVFQIVNQSGENQDKPSFKYTNQDILNNVLKFTYEQMQKDNEQNKKEQKKQVNANLLGEEMINWTLNQQLWQDVEDAWNNLTPEVKETLDDSDIFSVKLRRSQIRSVLIFAVKKATGV
ncbi:MAG: hypothetical protein QNJ33_14140 [Crocosphaera sp.]|nr:hypothetical protein [Crocosphaera sp.]